MTKRIIKFLENSDESGTLILVGHDGDLDALATMFGLSWHTAPFPPTQQHQDQPFDSIFVDENDDMFQEEEVEACVTNV